MKGDGDIKKTIIKFLGIGNDNRYQVNITIYDSKCNIVYKGRTKNGVLEVNLIRTQVYKLEATFLNEEIWIPFIPQDKLMLRLQNNLTHNITLLLSDYYYNLPIEKGEITLWQK